MDAHPQITHDAALVVRIATWLRGKRRACSYQIMFGRNDLAAGMAGLARLQRRRPVPCDALDGAGRGTGGMWMGRDPGADQRFGA